MHLRCFRFFLKPQVRYNTFAMFQVFPETSSAFKQLIF